MAIECATWQKSGERDRRDARRIRGRSRGDDVAVAPKRKCADDVIAPGEIEQRRSIGSERSQRAAIAPVRGVGKIQSIYRGVRAAANVNHTVYGVGQRVIRVVAQCTGCCRKAAVVTFPVPLPNVASRTLALVVNSARANWRTAAHSMRCPRPKCPHCSEEPGRTVDRRLRSSRSPRRCSQTWYRDGHPRCSA